MNLKTIRDSFHTQSLNVRNIHRLLLSDDFAIAYGNATKNERERISKNITHFDKDNIHKFIGKQLQALTPFHQMGVKQLRDIGRNIRLPGYWEMNKITLIKEIEDVVSRLKKDCK